MRTPKAFGTMTLTMALTLAATLAPVPATAAPSTAAPSTAAPSTAAPSTAAPSTAAPATAQPTRLSQGDPYAGCTIGATPTSVLYPGAEVEPSIAVNRRRPAQVVAAWQQDRWSDGGAHGLAGAYSSDGGRSFRRFTWPVSRCAPGGLHYERASDPWISIGPDGTVYGSALSFDGSSPRNAVVAVTSYDGGRTWRNTTEVIRDTEIAYFNDKNSVTADPVRAGSAYQVWDRFTTSPDGTRFVNGPTYLSVTRDFGRTWSAPRVIVEMAPYQQTIGNVIVGDPRTGVLYDFYTSIQYTDETASNVVFSRFEVVRSADAGRTWSRPAVVARDTGVLDTDPNTGAALRTGAGLPSPAIDPATGELYVAYEGSDFTGGAYNQIQLVHSGDGGRTWSTPVRVNRDTGTPAFTPTVAVTDSGDVGVTYYDLRTLKPGNTATLPTGTWLTVSPRGGARFGDERQIAPVFDGLRAPVAGGYFLGDYQGLAADDDTFRAVFVTTNDGGNDNRTDVRYGRFASFDRSELDRSESDRSEFDRSESGGPDERAGSAPSPRSSTPAASGGVHPLRPRR
ncbi:exo-alpha-sialidase [Planosporangium mesophilum]|uniref:Exo-alpha-sialidase n=1 Tax=Planosporangium mesophilum TaxID=689768 RepID=A0A8J3WXM2_9ACTN|nr:exo-alpha-sialidase [Planosporangium mesophilum]GII20405.1 hypothetical protein Pme01_00020 [Planosporangium mesophilum]